MSAPPAGPGVDAGIDRLVALDLMRGLAALAVLTYHIGYMLGDWAPHMPKGYLAVDFFFALSGFVMSASYGREARPGLCWRAFAAARLARLWPLFAIATMLGMLVATAKLWRDHGQLDASAIACAAGFNLALLPAACQPYGIDRLFPFNAAAWSVFFEVAANIVFFGWLRALSLRALAGVAGLAALLLTATAWQNGGLDGGWAAANWQVGAARVSYGFAAGMLVARASRRVTWRPDARHAAVAVLIQLAVLFVPGGWMVDCVAALLLYPALLWLAAAAVLPSPIDRVGRNLGDLSYSLYLLQTPAMLATAGAVQVLTGGRIGAYAPASGLVFIASMLVASHLCWRYFEMPARVHLQRLLGFRAPRTAYSS